ncbi:MAG: hypothetical protein ABI418_11525, partial [Jatrophihabitantaceae bacterium]
MNRTTRTGFRAATPLVLLIGGGGLAAATWTNGDHGFAIGLIGFYLIAAIAAYLWSGRDSDVAAIMRVGGDERQRRLDRDATSVSGLAMAAAATIGTVVQTATGQHNAGAYALIMFVGGVSYLIALAYL